MCNNIIKKKLSSIGKISNIQDSIVLCYLPLCYSLIGELICFNENINQKSFVFEISSNHIKIFLLDCDQKTLFIGDTILGLNETVKIKLGFPTAFSKVDNMNHLFYNAERYESSCRVHNFSKRYYSKKNFISISLK